MFITTDLAVGGAEMMLLKLLSRMDRKRFEPTVISLAAGGQLAEQIGALGIPAYSVIAKRRLLGLNGVRGLIRMVRSLDPDLIQGWMIHGNLAALIAGRACGKAVAWSVRHSRLRWGTEASSSVALDRLLACVSFYPRKIIYNSCAGRRYHEAIGYRAASSAVVPNGFDADVFAPSESARRTFRAALEVGEATILIGLIARYHPAKGHDTFLNAAGSLLPRYPAARFLLAGAGCGWSNSVLSSLIQKRVPRHAVHLLGERLDVQTVTAALDIATSASSSTEGCSNAIGEAMCCCVPCVVTDVGDSAALVGETGLVVPANDHRALFRGWVELIEMGAAARRELGHRARQRVREHFLIESVARRYEALYAEMLA